MIRKKAYILIGLKNNLTSTEISKKYNLTYCYITSCIKKMLENKMIYSKSKNGRKMYYKLHPQAYMAAKHLICFTNIFEENKWLSKR